MNITNRLYTYPILASEKDDYKKSVFEVDVSRENSNINSLVLEFKFKQTNQEIETLLFQKKAAFYIHIECSTTSYRRLISNKMSPTMSWTIPYKDINGRVELVAFILATENITKYSNSDWNEDFQGLTFDIPKGSIIAYQNLPDLIITKDDEDLQSASSIFSVVKDNVIDNHPATIELNSNKIKIILSAEEYKLYNKFSMMNTTRTIVNSLIVLPSLVYVFEELRQEGSADVYGDKSWFISLNNAYKKKNQDLIEVLNSGKTSLECAQEAMDLPITEALKKVDSIYMTEQEDD
jgi:hypothetical protein